MSGDITRRQALTLGAIGAGVLVIGATGAGLSALQSESPALAPNPTGTEGAGGQGWNEPSVVASSAGALELDLTAARVDRLFDDRAQRAARTAPGRPEINDNRLVLRRLHDVCHEVLIGRVLDVQRCRIGHRYCVP